MTLTASEGAVSGKLVLEARHVSKAYGERPIVKDFSTRVLRGDRLGVVGANGAGKTTLISVLTGTLEPDTGSIRLGANLEMATLDQKRASPRSRDHLEGRADRRAAATSSRSTGPASTSWAT